MNRKQKNMKNKVLVTGGAGYIGSILCRLLLKKGYKVRVLDKLLFGGESLVELLNDPNFEFIKGDVRNEEDRKKALKGMSMAVNLAAIVGDPACANDPDLAKETNLEATKKLYQEANEEGLERFIFASTCSNYGKSKNPENYMNEDSELSPVSLYAETKVAAEKSLLGQPKNNRTKPTCLRFATVYGLSPRMRFDLTVNEFTKDLALGKELLIFGEQFWRPYCHVEDLARSVVHVIEADQNKVAFDVFNVGDTSENYTKRMLADEMQEQLPEAIIKYVKKDEDPRDYRVNFDKINETLGFQITKTVTDGIGQIKKVVQEGLLSKPDEQKYRNS
ncbi:MAG: NAD(P)-dependent oxidoreductase [Bacteroidales bacterium]|nr:NAD(P)-dependent oxidoreductase [Bacteroidales bacterium]